MGWAYMVKRLSFRIMAVLSAITFPGYSQTQ